MGKLNGDVGTMFFDETLLPHGVHQMKKYTNCGFDPMKDGKILHSGGEFRIIKKIM